MSELLTTPAQAGLIVLRTLSVYLFIMVGFRLTGKREVGQLAPFDFALILLIANAVQNAMVGPDTSLVGGLTAGGAAVAASALGGAAVGTLVTKAEYELEITKLRALVTLYEQLEKVGIDAIIGAGMNVVRGSMDAVKGGLRLVRDGIAASQARCTASRSIVCGTAWPESTTSSGPPCRTAL